MQKEGGGGDDDNEIPLLGTVAAGQPIEAILSHDTVSVPERFAGTWANVRAACAWRVDD